MAIAGGKKKPVDLAPKQTPDTERYESATILDDVRPIQSLAPYVEGYSLVGDYYGQLLGPDDPIQEHSVDLSPINQTYKLIENMELKLPDEVDFEYIKAQQLTEFRFTATIYPGTVVPSRYDLFIVDVGNKQLNVFHCVDVTPKTQFSETIYEADFVSSKTLDEIIQADLDRKVADSGRFSKEFLLDGQLPVLKNRKIDEVHELHQVAKTILDDFVDSFLNHEMRYVLVPEQPLLTYDPYLHEFLRLIIELSQHPRLSDLSEPNVRQNNGLDVITIWDVIATGSVRRMTEKTSSYSTSILRNDPKLSGLYYTRLYNFIGPAGFESRVGTKLRGETPPEPYPHPTERPYIKNVDCDDYYVLSEAFYLNKLDEMSELERLLSATLQNSIIEGEVIIDLANQVMDWRPLERFYYTPLVVFLIQYALRGVS